MAAVAPTPVTVPTGSPAPVVDLQQWWADVQSGVSSLLTEAAHGGDTHRLAS